jgi:RimJ/RimL family protein N-acetyltransferase
MSSVELRTTRLRLRDFELGDFQAVHAFAADLAVVSYVEWGPNTPEQTQAFLREARASADVSRVGAMRLPRSTPMRKA